MRTGSRIALEVFAISLAIAGFGYLAFEFLSSAYM